MRRVVVGFSGGVTSAWCAGWALRNFPKDEVVLLWHDTKEEDADTYRFLREMAVALDHPITERSDGRSVTKLFYDMNMLANDQSAFCSRVLKREQGQKSLKTMLRSSSARIGASARWELRCLRCTHGATMQIVQVVCEEVRLIGWQ